MDLLPPKLTGTGPAVRLSVIRGPGEGSSVRLTRPLTMIGSRTGCKVVLRHASVGPIHCAIVNTGYEIFLRDLGTPSGTYLNDLRAECERLEDGYVVRVAQWEFQVELAESPGRADPLAPAVDLEPSPTVALQVTGNGRLVKLHREVSVIGRRAGCDVLLQHRRVSRAHAAIAAVLGQPSIFDLLSENGVALNGQAVGFAPLHSGDVLEIGPVSLRVVIPEATLRPTAKPDTRTGTATATAVIELDEDIEDKIDIRAAEMGPRDAM